MKDKPKKWASCCIILNLITTFLSWPTRVLASRDRPLNVLFIIADDLGKTSDLDFLNCTHLLVCVSGSAKTDYEMSKKGCFTRQSVSLP